MLYITYQNQNCKWTHRYISTHTSASSPAMTAVACRKSKPVYLDFEQVAAVVRVFADEKLETDDAPEEKRLFTETGFSIKENKYKDGCPEVYLGKTCLYCHPQSLSGPVLKEHMELIEKILAQGTTFRYLRTDTYGEILDLTEEEELAYYHKTHDMTIGGVFLDAFRTKRRNLYKSREQVLEILVEKLRVKTLRGKSVYSNTSPAYRYIREMYGKMVSEGRLVEGCKQTASGKLPLCRTATGRELKMKRREDDRTE